MASLLFGGLFASKALYQYNRKNFMLDRKLKQERDFQEQDMRVEQFGLYREDVRDLVELTVSKMDLYLVVAALLVDRTTVLICKQHEALPHGSPEWAVALNALSLASGVFYLLLSLWLAMYASVSAQSFGARLLTQFVRLPIASKDQLAAATSTGIDYEARSVQELLRVPVLQQRGPGTRDDGDQLQDHGSASSSAANPGFVEAPEGNTAANSTDISSNLLPTAMLDHIRLYRRVQLNWQAYDAYARVSLFAGANSLLYSCLYWCLGQFLQNSHATLPALGCAVIFSSIQATLSRLDLKLRPSEVWAINFLLILTPICTTVGMLLYMDMIDYETETSGLRPPQWKLSLMQACAVATHALHTVVMLLLLRGSWPDPAGGEDARLPGKFRSVLYLDVFGWLLNPTGPGAGRLEEEEDEYYSDDETTYADSVNDAENDSARGLERNPSQGSETSMRTRSASMRSQSDEALPPASRSHLAGPSPPRSRRLSSGDMVRSREGSQSAVPSPPRSRCLSSASSMRSGGGSPRRASRSRSEDDGRITFSPALRDEARRLLYPSSFNAASLRSGPRDCAPSVCTDRGTMRGTRRRSIRPLQGPASGTASPPQPSAGSSSLSAAAEAQRAENVAMDMRWGGREAVPMEEMERFNAPTAGTVANFAGTAPPRRVSRRVKLPGETPWRAFCHGTVVILMLWAASTLWSLYRMVFGRGWRTSTRPEASTHVAVQSLASQDTRRLMRSVCAATRRLPSLRILHASLAEAQYDGFRMRVQDGGCSFRWPTLDSSLVCQKSEDLVAGRCLAAFLRRGGRTASLCHLLRRGTSLMAVPAASLRVLPGAPTLTRLSVHWPLSRFGSSADGVRNATYDGTVSTSASSSASSRAWPRVSKFNAGALESFRLFGRGCDGELLALKLEHSSPFGRVAQGRWRHQMSLVPTFEVTPSSSSRPAGEGKDVALERLWQLQIHADRQDATPGVQSRRSAMPRRLLLSIARIPSWTGDNSCHAEASLSTTMPTFTDEPADWSISIWDTETGFHEQDSWRGFDDVEDPADALVGVCGTLPGGSTVGAAGTPHLAREVGSDGVRRSVSFLGGPDGAHQRGNERAAFYRTIDS